MLRPTIEHVYTYFCAYGRSARALWVPGKHHTQLDTVYYNWDIEDAYKLEERARLVHFLPPPCMNQPFSCTDYEHIVGGR